MRSNRSTDKLHLFQGNSVYTNAYIDFVNRYFTDESHLFLVLGSTQPSKNISPSNIINISRFRDLLRYKKCLQKCKKIILHGFFYEGLPLLFWAFNQKLLGKSYWSMWGGDLYFYKFREKYLRSDIDELMRKQVFRKMGNITTLVRGDYELAKSVYRTRARYFPTFYPNPVDFSIFNKLSNPIETINQRTLLLGNSASPRNNHIEIIRAISRFKNKGIRVICPLGYGDMEYAKRVIEEGKHVLGDNFFPLTEFLNPEEYAKILYSVEIGIFNHDRQQGFSTIIALLYLGKKVYIRDDTTLWTFFRDTHMEVFNTQEIYKDEFDSLFTMNDTSRLNNRNSVLKELSIEKCVTYWKKVFES